MTGDFANEKVRVEKERWGPGREWEGERKNKTEKEKDKKCGKKREREKKTSPVLNMQQNHRTQ